MNVPVHFSMDISSIIHTLPYAPFAIIVGGFIDVFFLTGYLAYGFALSSAVVMLYASGNISIPALFIASYIGTVLGSLANFVVGWYLARTPLVRRMSDSPRATIVRSKLVTYNLFLAMLVCRFVTLLRPAYMVLLGTLRVHPTRVILYESIIALIWVCFWSTILVTTGATLTQIVKYILVH